MRRLLYTLLITVAVLTTSCTYNQDMNREHQSNDTIYTSKAAMEIYDYNPERALLILDSAEIVGNLSHDRASYYRAKVLTMTFEGIYLDSAQNICVNLLNSNYIKNVDNHESVLDLLVSISRRKQSYEQWLKWSTEKADLCRKQGDDVEALRTEAEIGVILAYLGRQDEGLEKLDDVINQLDGIRKFNEMDACIIALRRKVDVLSEFERNDEIIQVAKKIIDKTDDYEENFDEINDGSFRQPSDANILDYCEFYRVKAYAYLARAYSETTDKISARYYLTMFENSRYGQTVDGRMMISSTWCKMGDYDKMLAIYDEVESYLKDDTINENYSIMLHNRAIAAEASGQFKKAYNYMKRHADLSQLINYQIQQSTANEHAAKYRAQEQEIEINRQTIQNRMMNYVLLIMLIAMMSFIFLYNHSVVQKKRLAEKNNALSKLIDASIKQNNKDDIRLYDACRMLREQPEMKIADIAKKVGLSPRAMQKLFQEQYGMSPTEYRVSHTV